VLAEQTRAQGAEAGIQAALDQEILDRAADVLAEKTRAEAAEASLRTDLNTEIADRATAVSAEMTRAQGEEAALLAAINQEITDRGLAVSAEALARANAVSAEQTRAEGVEASLQTQITAEIGARESAITALDAALTGLINDEETRALAAEGVLQDAIDAEAAARAAADATLTTNLAAEVTRATAAEGSLRTDLNTEIADRQAAVSAEALARQDADDNLSADIAAEETRAMGAESALGVRIDGEIAAREAAIIAEAAARVQGDADTLDAAKAYSDALVQGLKVKDSVRVAVPWKFEMGPQGSEVTYVLPADFAALKGTMGVDAGDRILLIDSEAYGTSIDEGIYVVNSAGTALVRAPDMKVGSDASGAYTYVEEGILGSNIPHATPGTGFVCSNVKGSDVVGTDALSWAIWSRAENLTFSGGVKKTGLDVDLKIAASAPFSQANGLALEMDSNFFESPSGVLKMKGTLVEGPMHIADALHGHGRISKVRAATGANESHFAKYDGNSATWDSASCMAFVETKNASSEALIVFSGEGKSAALSASLAAFSVGETVYLGQAGGEFSDFASVPSGKWAIPVGKKMAGDALNVFIGVPLLKA
jgi:hypothetical protein